MIVALYVLVTLSLVFAQRCLRPGHDAPEPSINQIDLADLSHFAHATRTNAPDKPQTREFADHSTEDYEADVAATCAPICTNFAHISAQCTGRSFAAHFATHVPAAFKANARSRAPPALLT
ncbi:protein of unknown function [Hyphomicrobium sp. 1Nfss2.1]|uniref:hypothetical protein n=1 Tax=Hyphomicrobium sp. 1Nfss2.1 TaxID=3413936 RepID=UPI003C7B065E